MSPSSLKTRFGERQRHQAEAQPTSYRARSVRSTNESPHGARPELFLFFALYPLYQSLVAKHILISLRLVKMRKPQITLYVDTISPFTYIAFHVLQVGRSSFESFLAAIVPPCPPSLAAKSPSN